MNRSVKLHSGLVCPLLAGTILAFAASAQATEAQVQTEPGSAATVREQSQNYGQESTQAETLEQVTAVSQLSDVQPTDWAFGALQSLVERYGCIAGYPNGTYRGNRTLTRYEFAAGLNACLDRINELIATGTADLATQQDLATLQRLQEEFATELATLRGRVDGLQVRTRELEATQFSTTTQLLGEVVFGLSGVAAGDEVNGTDIDQNPVFSDRVRLEFNTSFSGKDLLFTRLATGNTTNLLQETTFEGVLGFEQDEDNDLGLEVLFYQFPIGDRTEITLGPAGVATDDFTDTVNLLDGDGGAGAISLFGTRNSIYFPPEGAGLGIRHQVSEIVEVSAGYLAAEANDPSAGAGLFDGAYGAIAQVLVSPHETLDIAVTYVHGLNVEFGTGSLRANPKTFIEDTFGGEAAIDSDAVGLELSWRLSDRITLGGWVTYAGVEVLGGPLGEGNLDIWTWAVTLGFPDLVKYGDLAGIVVGMEPKVTESDLGLEDEETSIHVEAFYQHQLTENIAITPGIIWLTAPDHDGDNDDVVIGTIRTTFAF